MTLDRARRSVIAVAVGLLLPALAPAAAHAASAAWYQNGNSVGETHRPAIAWQEIKLESGAVGEIHCMNVMNLSVWDEGAVGAGAFEGWGTNACKAPALEETLEKTYESAIKEGLIKSPLTVFATSEMELRPEDREGEICSAKNKTKMSECEALEERKVSKELTLNNPNGLHRRGDSFPWKVNLTTGIREEEEVALAQIGAAPEGHTCYPKERVIVEGKEVERSAKWQNVPAGCLKIDVVCPQIPAEVVFYGSLEALVLNGSKNGLFPTKLKFNKESGVLVSSVDQAPDTTVSGELKIDGMRNEELLQARF